MYIINNNSNSNILWKMYSTVPTLIEFIIFFKFSWKIWKCFVAVSRGAGKGYEITGGKPLSRS